MRRALTYARDFGALVMHYCEDRDLAGEGVMAEGERASRLGLPGVPREAETIALDRDLRLIALTKTRYHAAFVSNALSLEAMARAKGAGLAVTCGVSINHLTLNETDVGDYRTFLKLAPPLRPEAERLALVAALADGLIDVVVSDHDPQDVETKRLPFAEAEAGAIGLETMLSAGLRLVSAGQIGLPRLLRAMSTRPAEILGIAVGPPQPRRARRPHPVRSGRAVRARSGDAAFALPQHAVRSGADGRARQTDHGCRPHRPRIACRPIDQRWEVALAPFALPTEDWLGLALGYLCGSIPFGLLLTRAAGTADLRSIGSGNIGATNVLRTGRKDLAAATLLLDALKGTAAVLIARALLGADAAFAAALGAFLGHLYPVWIGFRGGKGVATFLGCLIAVDWRAALVFAAVWLAVAALTRFSSASALAASALAPLALWSLARPSAGRPGLRAARRAAVVQAPRQYRSAVAGPRDPDR